MFSKYIKLTLNKKNSFLFIKLNIFTSTLLVLLFFILPVLIKRYYIIGKYEAMAINAFFLFSFETSIVFISRDVLSIYEQKKHNERIFFKALFFALIKSAYFIIFFYLFKKAISIASSLAFLLCFFSMFVFFCIFWIPCLLIKNNFISSLKKSIYLYFSYPFFTTFVFLHSILLFFISMITLNLYPGESKIIYNMYIALYIMERKNKSQSLKILQP